MAKGGRRRGSKGRGWGVPFPKISRRQATFSQAVQGPRTEEDLLRLQGEWAIGYTARVRAHRLLGLSMGTPLDDVEERYRLLVSQLPFGDTRRQALDLAFDLIQSTVEGATGERPASTVNLEDGEGDEADLADSSGEALPLPPRPPVAAPPRRPQSS